MIKHEGERCARPCACSQSGGCIYLSYSSLTVTDGSSMISNYAGEVSPPCVAFAYSIHLFCSFAALLLVKT